MTRSVFPGEALTVAKSSLPSPLKSPSVSASGMVPKAATVGGCRVPFPLLS